MNWQPMTYCFSLASLIASVVGGVFAPFCRNRESVHGPAAAPARRTTSLPERDRVNEAMRQWKQQRAQADLACPAPHRLTADKAPLLRTVAAQMAAEQTQGSAAAVETNTAAPEPAMPESAPAEPAAEPPQAHVELEEDTFGREEQSQTVEEPNPFLHGDLKDTPNFYDILQISPRADLDTIHRVYRIMAARFHPDNPVSGDHERFLQLCEAYEVLSNSGRRAQYDCVLRAKEAQPMPIFEMRVFVDGIEGEINRRFGILALLYHRRKINPVIPGVSTLELEQRMSLPREHLEFTLWYLRSKNYLQIMEDNSDFAITAAGADWVEANLPTNPIVRELLKTVHPGDRTTSEARTRPRGRNRNPRQREDRRGAIAIAR